MPVSTVIKTETNHIIDPELAIVCNHPHITATQPIKQLEHLRFLGLLRIQMKVMVIPLLVRK